MATRRKKLIVVGFGLLVITALVLFHWNDEPRYGGHSLSYWVGIYSNTPAETARADEAVRHIGTNAIPYLLKWISEEPSRTEMFIAINRPIDWLNRKLNPNADWTFRDKLWFRPAAASRAFEALGSQAQPAIPGLSRILNECQGENTGILTAKVLGSFGQLGLLPLAEALTNSNARVRIAAAIGFSRLGTNAEPAASKLIQALADEDGRVKWSVCQALRFLKLDSAFVIPAMITHVASENPYERMNAALILAEYKSLARPALPALLHALDKSKNSTDISERGIIKEAIRKIDPQSLTNAPPP